MAAQEGVFDFTNVKDGGGTFNKRHLTPGDYKAKITKVEDAPSKKDGIAQWLYTIEAGGGTYPYYCKHVENQFWKIRNLLIAAGISVPKKKVKVNPNVLVGKTIAVTLDDEEYDGKMQSVISATFPVSELNQTDTEDEDEETETEEEEEEAPAPKKKAPAPEPEEDDEDEDEAPPPPKKKKAPAPAEDDLEELDIDDV